jgi:hypothetical protein
MALLLLKSTVKGLRRGQCTRRPLHPLLHRRGRWQTLALRQAQQRRNTAPRSRREGAASETALAESSHSEISCPVNRRFHARAMLGAARDVVHARYQRAATLGQAENQSLQERRFWSDCIAVRCMANDARCAGKLVRAKGPTF